MTPEERKTLQTEFVDYWVWDEEEFLKTAEITISPFSLQALVKSAMIAGGLVVIEAFDEDITTKAGSLNLHEDGLHMHAGLMDNFTVKLNLTEAAKWVAVDMSKDDAVAIATELQRMASEILLEANEKQHIT